MALTTGTRLGPYEIQSPIGAGGMGEVYRARDTKLGREVALKVLPEAFARDPDRLARFDREAKTLASLNHPHIAQIYGFEHTDGRGALVMEFVDGEDLAQRIARGPISLDEALPIARQVASALEAAHEQNIIHRDLKPANIKARADGTVKVLDFGLARAIDDTGAGHSGAADPASSPTITSPAMITMRGVILGTAAYMAPEQAKGRAADKRSDIWAFGCVLYEMLSGRPAFNGDGVADTLAAILSKEPNWSALPASTPRAIRQLLARCLQKDPARRLRHIGDATLDIDEAQTETPATDAPPHAMTRSWLPWLVAMTLLAIAAVLASLLLLRPTPAAPEMRVEITTPQTTDQASIAISPDGQTIAFVATEGGRPRLWLRPLATVSARPLAGTEGASFPFWAPHGRSLGFFADDGWLKRIDLDGGTVRVLANAPLPRGGAWNTDDTILFAPMTGPIYRLSTAGERTQVTKVAMPQASHGFPRFLPDGIHFLYYVPGGPDIRGVYLGGLDGSGERRLVDADSIGVATAKGHLLFMRSGTLYAQRFDPVRLELKGNAFPAVEGIAQDPLLSFQVAAFSASAAGHIIYRTGSAGQDRRFVWFDRFGKEAGKVGNLDRGVPLSPAVSPDGNRVALQRNIDGNVDIWILDLGRGGLSRFTTHTAAEIHPLWSVDGTRILFNSNRTGSYQLYEKSTLGIPEEKPILPMQSQPTGWSPDGRLLLFQHRDPDASTDIWVLPYGTDRKPYPILDTRFEERDAQFSPNGKWITYSSVESGRSEIYIQPFPGPGGRVPVSVNGGAQPRWRRDGKELFFIALDGQLMAVPISHPSTGGSLDVGAPTPLFPTSVGGAIQGASRSQYIVSADGSRFLMNTLVQGPAANPIILILNWKPRPADARQ
jgi:Tol biopolymer transport system component